MYIEDKFSRKEHVLRAPKPLPYFFALISARVHGVRVPREEEEMNDLYLSSLEHPRPFVVARFALYR